MVLWYNNNISVIIKSFIFYVLIGNIVVIDHHCTHWLSKIAAIFFSTAAKCSCVASSFMYQITMHVQMYLWEPLLWISSSFTSHAPAILDGAMTYGGIFSSAYSQVGRSYQLLAYPLYVPENAQVKELFKEAKMVSLSSILLFGLFHY